MLAEPLNKSCFTHVAHKLPLGDSEHFRSPRNGNSVLAQLAALFYLRLIDDFMDVQLKPFIHCPYESEHVFYAFPKLFVIIAAKARCARAYNPQNLSIVYLLLLSLYYL